MTSNNYAWVKVFYHDSSQEDWFSDSEALSVNSKNKFSILGNINEKHKIGQYFEFMIEYEETGTRVIWKQKKNIKDTTTKDTSKTIGYVGNKFKYFGGLTRSDYSGDTVFDGVTTDIAKFWNFAIGAKQKYLKYNTFPGPTYDGVNSDLMTKVALYIKTRVFTYNFRKVFIINIFFVISLFSV